MSTPAICLLLLLDSAVIYVGLRAFVEQVRLQRHREPVSADSEWDEVPADH